MSAILAFARIRLGLARDAWRRVKLFFVDPEFDRQMAEIEDQKDRERLR